MTCITNNATMKKHILDLRLTENTQLHSAYALMKFRPVEGTLPEMLPGQFAEVRISDSTNTYLRRPISIHNVIDKIVGIFKKEDNTSKEDEATNTEE